MYEQGSAISMKTQRKQLNRNNLALRANNVGDKITNKGTSLILHNTKCEANSVIPISDICIETNECSNKTCHVFITYHSANSYVSDINREVKENFCILQESCDL
jgi:hypothetical protein